MNNHRSHIMEEFLQYALSFKSSQLHGLKKYEKRQFLQDLPDIRKQAFKRDTIAAGWAKRGIYTWDPYHVLDALEQRIPSPPLLKIYGEDEEGSDHLFSSKTIQKLQHQINIVEKAIQNIKNTLDSESSLMRHLKKFKASLSHAELNKQQTVKLKNYLIANRHHRAKTSHQQVQLESVLTVKDANRQITRCGKNEAEK
ncbi:hypothetical protein EMCG_01636 [[Emmonsia] crescens]|uniref:Uncharacterized protein n=1 Tax=[Emmonsia] crescens TaxID=73230 RepID=A0A0G2I0D8_9EURO|nr:hypothetical protein EMCG_01636 [Emmonsia crescens UAMH 3008]